VTAELTHLNKLKVIRFRGSRSKFIMGFTTREATLIPTPAASKVL
jgi:hypothetical protein